MLYKGYVQKNVYRIDFHRWENLNTQNKTFILNSSRENPPKHSQQKENKQTDGYFKLQSSFTSSGDELFAQKKSCFLRKLTVCRCVTLWLKWKLIVFVPKVSNHYSWIVPKLYCYMSNLKTMDLDILYLLANVWQCKMFVLIGYSAVLKTW